MADVETEVTRGFIDGEYQDGEIRGCTFLAGIRGMGKSTEMGRRIAMCGGGAVFFDPVAKHAHLMPGGVLVHQPGDYRTVTSAQMSGGACGCAISPAAGM